MLSQDKEIEGLHLSLGSLDERILFLRGLAHVAYQASLLGSKVRGQIWRVAEAVLPEKQELWDVLREAEHLVDVEREERIDALYSWLEKNPGDQMAFGELRRLQSEEAVQLVQDFRASLPARASELVETLNEIRKQLDEDSAEGDCT